VGEVLLIDPATVRVLLDGADQRAAALRDALEHVADMSTAGHVDLPVAGADRWLWWFSTPQAGRWEWQPAAVARLATASAGTADLDAILALKPAAQAVWPDDIDLEALGVVRELTGPQRRDVARMTALGGGANFSVPGAGKTTMAYVCYAILRARGKVRRMLVVAPLSAHEAWTLEPADIFTPGSRPAVAVRPRIPHGDVVVVNYERLESRGHAERLRAWCAAAPTLVVFDEAHRAKAGRSGVRGAAALELSRTAARRAVLTGTPRPNDARDLANVLDLTYPGRGAGLAAGPARQLTSAYCRITKAELGLPELVVRTEQVPMSAAHDRVYDAMIDRAARAALADPTLVSDLARAGSIALLLIQAATDPTAVVGAGGPLRMARDSDHLGLAELLADLPANFVPTKLVRVAQLVNSYAQQGTKVVVWACFRHHVTQLRRLLEPYGPAFVDGSLAPTRASADTDRTRELARFRADPDCQVLIATPHTLGEGVSLHHTTTHQIHLDRTFNAGLFLQSLDRTHRLGLPADAHCSATFLVAERADGQATVDSVVAARLEAKVAAMGRALDDPGLARLALPSEDDRLRPTDVLLGAGGADDLAALFSHLLQARH